MNNSFLEQILENTPCAIFWKGTDGIFLGCNDYFATVSGFKDPSEIVGKYDRELPWNDRWEDYQRDDQKVIQTGQSITCLETIRLATGENIIAKTYKSPLRKGDQIIGVLGFYTNITEFVQAQKLAETANLAKAHFLASMSHELRTPMNAVQGMAQILLENTKLTDEQYDYVKTIYQASGNMVSLINDILDFSKMEANRLDLYLEEFDLHRLIHEINMTMQHLLDKKPITLNIEYLNAVPRLVLGDQKRIRQILVNLLGNSIKFTHRGHIDLCIECVTNNTQKAEIKFTVKDTGIGIPENKINVIFDRFTQVESQYSRRFEGAGLGLAITKNLVDLMQGKIEVSSEEGVGTTFWLQIPFALPVSQEEPTILDIKTGSIASDSSELIKQARAKILLVEDNPINQKVASVMLLKLGCLVDIADNGQQAIKLAANNKYDLIFMDIGLPDIDGIETTRLLKQTKRPFALAPIIALTAHVFEEDREHCLEAGMEDIITKPLSREAIEIIIQRFVLNKPKSYVA